MQKDNLNQTLNKNYLRNNLLGTEAADFSEGLLEYPEKVLQIGEGNFIRAFVDWMLHQMNKKGGITTLEEKSLGCTQKGGTSTVRGVNFYGEQVRGRGLQLLESPGNDLVSTTALTAAGAHLILFTTGRGTPFGAPVPTVKISTNSNLYQKKRNWIDFNAGQLLTGVDMEELADEFFEYILGLASGKIYSRNEEKENDYREIAIFKAGVTL